MEVWNEFKENEDVLDYDITNWSSPEDHIAYSLMLEGMIHSDTEERNRSRKRNLIRLEKAKKRRDILNLIIHYSCCIDTPQLEAIENLVTNDNRNWESFTMVGINDFGDFYSPQASSVEIQFLFQALKKIRLLDLQSCILHRGHGLEMMLKQISSFTSLTELRLQGWQIDRISASTLIRSLQEHNGKTIRTLSMRSCRFLGENTFFEIVRGLKCIDHLKTLEVSCCNLGDNGIILLIESIKTHPSIECVNLERNHCRTQASVSTIAKWIVESQCKVRALNVRALWTGFSEEGLEQRFVDPVPLFTAVAQSSSLRNLIVSENYLENDEIQHLTQSLLSRRESSNLYTLDAGANPFDEAGAKMLLKLVRNLQTLKNIIVENSFLQYKCTELIKIQAEINYFNAFMGKNLDIPLSLWPHALARIQKGTLNRMPNNYFERSTNHTYRLLRATTGSYGKQLSHRIALRNTVAKGSTIYNVS
mmetsp:Transcript_7256/g.15519  ORF Transcript_7256/g.15519 Transcript_7256/m.15519 type:complete len:476 (+) Transcript_7256:368-1795(+)